MHELTLAEQALRIVEAAARKAQAQRVTRIRLAVGALAHVDPETLQYCCEVVSRDTLAAGASIEIERRPGLAWCADCQSEVALSQWGMPCPQCAGYQLSIVQGDEMQVVNIGVE